MSFWRLYFFFFFYLFFYTINLSTNFRLFTEFYRSTLHISFILCLSFFSHSFLIHVFSYRLIKLSLIFLTPWISWKFYFYLYLYLYIGLEATYKRAWMYLIVIVKYVEGKLFCLYFYLTKKKIRRQGEREKNIAPRTEGSMQSFFHHKKTWLI